VAISKIQDTGSFSVGGTKYWAINTCIVRYYRITIILYRTITQNTGQSG